MDAIHAYLPNGMRVVISEDREPRLKLSFGYLFDLQIEGQSVWETVQSTYLPWVDAIGLESRIDGVICDLLAKYDRKLKREQAEDDARSRLKSILHGKVRDVKCPAK
ncbi:hypothetical protein [Brevibacillus laterosporus]|uniref:hypothetical protein n=1 Tax=Brevibacillus laterosporus TaxID=1465 RepID=UPI003D1B280E